MQTFILTVTDQEEERFVLHVRGGRIIRRFPFLNGTPLKEGMPCDHLTVTKVCRVTLDDQDVVTDVVDIQFGDIGSFLGNPAHPVELWTVSSSEHSGVDPDVHVLTVLSIRMGEGAEAQESDQATVPPPPPSLHPDDESRGEDDDAEIPIRRFSTAPSRTTLRPSADGFASPALDERGQTPLQSTLRAYAAVHAPQMGGGEPSQPPVVEGQQAPRRTGVPRPEDWGCQRDD